MRQLLPGARELAPDDLPDLYDGGPRPLLRAGFVVALDGSTTVEGRSDGLSGPGDLAVFRALRTVSDAVLVGAGTARSEDYGPVRHRPAAAAWRVAHERAPQTPLVVVTRTGRLDPGARLFQGPVLIIAPARADTAALPCEVLRAGDDDVDLPAALRLLRERGLAHVLCEGGPQLLTDLVSAALVDELCLTHAPVLAGSQPPLLTRALPTPAQLSLVSLLHDEPGLLLARWSVVRSAGD